MRKIILVEFITLDGVIQAPGGSKEDTAEGFKYGGWMSPYFDDAGGKEMQKQMEETAGLLLGRKTYDIFSGFWPQHATEAEGWPQINKIPKYVISETLKKPTWENTEVLNDINALRELKKSSGPDLQVYGSANLIQSLFENDLVDELWLKIFPLTLGTGKRLFENGTIPAAFKLYKSAVTPSGVFFGYYSRAGEVNTEDIS